jgi:serine/threonine-protein kinase
MIGSRLGKWVIDSELGRGGMGRVYLAHDEGDAGQQAAVKVLSADLAQEAGFLERFKREIDVLSELNHPNIVRLYESGSQDGLNFFAMEYVEGEDFEQLLHKLGRLPWRDVLDAALQVSQALKHAHDRGIIHRDLKPPNLLRTADRVVKLTDFGIAKVFAGRHLTNVGGVVGTAEYLSPEQATGKQSTKRSDLYSLGVVLYTLLTGRTPFEGQSTAEILHKHLYGQFSRPNKLVPEIPPDFDEVVCQLLEKDPAKRPPDGLVLYRQLDSIRRKLERKSQMTRVGSPTDPTVAENAQDLPEESKAGPATLMSRMMRRELEEQNRLSAFSQWLNQPVVLIALLLLCVGILGWRFWPRSAPSAEEQFRQGSELMASADPADWDRGWTDYLEPLQRSQPNGPYKEQIEDFHQQYEDQSALRRAVHRIRIGARASEAQRFYERGLRLCQEGDPEAARQVWQDVTAAFGSDPAEARWTGLCERGLIMLERKLPANEQRPEIIHDALTRAKKAEPPERDRALQALRKLYHDDPEALKQLK